MVNLVDLDDPAVVYQGEIFWDMLRPGVRLPVLGPAGCITSHIVEVVPTSDDQFFIRTRNSRYLLTAYRSPTPQELHGIDTVAG